MKQWTSRGKVPPGYNVDHQIAIGDKSRKGVDRADNMRLKNIATHKYRHKIYNRHIIGAGDKQ